MNDLQQTRVMRRAGDADHAYHGAASNAAGASAPANPAVPGTDGVPVKPLCDTAPDRGRGMVARPIPPSPAAPRLAERAARRRFDAGRAGADGAVHGAPPDVFNRLVAVGRRGWPAADVCTAPMLIEDLKQRIKSWQECPVREQSAFLGDVPMLLQNVLAAADRRIGRDDKAAIVDFIALAMATAFGTILPGDAVPIALEGKHYMLNPVELRYLAWSMRKHAKQPMRALADKVVGHRDPRTPMALDYKPARFKAFWSRRDMPTFDSLQQGLRPAFPKTDWNRFLEPEMAAAAAILNHLCHKEAHFPVSGASVDKPLFTKKMTAFFKKNPQHPLTRYRANIIDVFPEAAHWFDNPPFVIMALSSLQNSSCSRREVYYPYTIDERFAIRCEQGHLAVRDHAGMPPWQAPGSNWTMGNPDASAKPGCCALAGLAQHIRSRLPIESLQTSAPVAAEALHATWDALAAQTQFISDGIQEFMPAADVLQRYPDVRAPRATALDDTSQSRYWKLHANHVGMGADHAFIAAQKPLTGKQSDSACGFWMAMQAHKVALIVDLTNDGDDAQEDHYGPTVAKPALALGAIKVNLAQRDEFDLGSVETVKVVTGYDGPDHAVTRLKFDAWTDHGVISPQQLIFLARKAESLCAPHASIVVHCRAGVGRTGTLMSYMASDDLIRKELHRHPTISVDTLLKIVMRSVMQGRQDRGPMFVQTEEQFRLVVNALLLRHADALA